MTSYTPKDLIKFLEKHGRVVDHSRGSHIVLYHESQKKRTTVPQHTGRKDLPEGTLQAILRQTGFTKKDLDREL